MISREPQLFEVPRLWAEDGKVFYHDAYMVGWPSLFYPLGGYLNSFSRLIALLVQPFALAWVPILYLLAAFICQLLPAGVMLSKSMEDAIPSWPGRFAITCFYAALPNVSELNFNLTNAQWHLAMASFLLTAQSPQHHKINRVFTYSVLLISGISGPFSIFLAPIAFGMWLFQRNTTSLTKALLITSTALIQTICLAVTLAAHPRHSGVLQASLPLFLSIMANKFFLCSILGAPLASAFLSLPGATSEFVSTLILCFFGMIFFAAWRHGSQIFKWALLWSGIQITAALIEPLDLNWHQLNLPEFGLRYFAIPSLVCFSGILIAAFQGAKLIRYFSFGLLILSIYGALLNWPYQHYHSPSFSDCVQAFNITPPGGTITCPETPNGWAMTLTKH